MTNHACSQSCIGASFNQYSTLKSGVSVVPEKAKAQYEALRDLASAHPHSFHALCDMVLEGKTPNARDVAHLSASKVLVLDPGSALGWSADPMAEALIREGVRANVPESAWAREAISGKPVMKWTTGYRMGNPFRDRH